MLIGNGKKLRISQSQCGTGCGTVMRSVRVYCVFTMALIKLMAEGAGFEPAHLLISISTVVDGSLTSNMASSKEGGLKKTIALLENP